MTVTVSPMFSGKPGEIRPPQQSCNRWHKNLQWMKAKGPLDVVLVATLLVQCLAIVCKKNIKHTVPLEIVTLFQCLNEQRKCSTTLTSSDVFVFFDIAQTHCAWR